jgi:AraC-like DNA-binding protein
MHLAIYDLLGALFATPDLQAPSSHSNKLFTRVCSIIKTRFTAPDFGPREAAAEAGISLRYLQKLFTARGTSCTNFLRSVRLDHAACQLHRRTLLGPRRPISEIAYASGFNDYTHFARQFRRRFGRAPGAHSPDHGHPWRSRAAEETPSAHDVYLSASSNVLESVPVDEIYRSHSNDSLWALRKTRAIRKDAA